MGRGQIHAGLWWRDLREDPDVDGRIILKWILEKWDVGRHGLDRSDFGQGQVAGSCEFGNEP
jgi:hypothetical protein